jgi:uncharacterized protein (TIGR02118 family)
VTALAGSATRVDPWRRTVLRRGNLILAATRSNKAGQDVRTTVDTKITVIYDNPADPDAFEAEYPDQMKLAQRVPGVRRFETAKVWPKEDGTPTPAYRFIDMYFPSYDAASSAVLSEEAGRFFESVFALGTGGVRITFAEVCEET